MLILAKHWPSWAFNLASTGFQLRTLVLLDAKWLSTCKRLLPPDLVLLYPEFLLDQACTLAADVVISDIDPPASFQLWHRVHLIYISRQGVKHRCTAPPALFPTSHPFLTKRVEASPRVIGRFVFTSIILSRGTINPTPLA